MRKSRWWSRATHQHCDSAYRYLVLLRFASGCTPNNTALPGGWSGRFTADKIRRAPVCPGSGDTGLSPCGKNSLVQILESVHVEKRNVQHPCKRLLQNPADCHICCITYLLTPWCRVLLEKLTGLQLVKKFPAFHGTRRFITALTIVRHLSLSWANSIQSIYPHPTSWRSIRILSTHLRLVLPSGLLPSGFPSKTLYIPLSSPIRATCPAHLILLDFITRTILGEE